MNPKLAALLFASVMGTASAADIAGDWEMTAQVLNDVTYSSFTLTVDGAKLGGTFGGNKIEGTIDGNSVDFTPQRPNGQPGQHFIGTLAANELKGTIAQNGNTWSARRALAPPASPRTHEFEPKEFHRVFSDAIAPALHISPGDTVRTWTVDAGGFDAKGVRRSQGGNPQTGPFYIEGAFPGDTVVVKLGKLRLNRDSAASGTQIVPSALNPNYVAGTKYENNFSGAWELDREHGVARLKTPSEHLKNYTVKLQPMLGCVAVAPPAHQAFRTGYLGNYGGNLDYNQVREGTAIYLPVFVPGALLFIGDGHAAQGDGELTGDALETSMDVEFTVTLLKRQSTGQPRVESDEYLMALGIGNSLADALQLATTSLVSWLQRDYHLQPNEAAIVLGTAVQYNIAEVVDPLVHVVAKVRKDALAALK